MHRGTALIALVFAVLVGDFAVAQRAGGAGAAGQTGRGGGRAAGIGPEVRDALRGRRDQAAGTAAIRGRVTAADSGAPVRRAQVRAQAAGSGARLVTTDGDGRYELRDLPAGRWLLSASKGGFIQQQHGQRHAFDTAQPIELADGQRVTADFSLSRGGVITGQVFDEFGDPITGARVQVMRSQMRQGRRQLTTVATADQTDDIGAFRIFGLAPGEYYVAGNLRAAPVESPDGATTYAPTYYPGAGSLAEAQRVSVKAGTEQTGVNFVLLPVRAVRVSGSVISSSGEPAPAAIQLLSAGSTEDGPAVVTSGAANANGAFTIPNVVPGSYTLTVTGRLGGRGGRGAGAIAAAAEIEMASVPLVVGDSDLTGVTVVTARGATVKGTVVFDGTAARPTQGVRVATQPLRQGPSPSPPAPVSAAGTFELAGLMGPHALRVEGLGQDWTLRSLTANGRDITNGPFDFQGSNQVTVRIVLTDRITELTGTVRDGSTATDGSVVIFADDPEKWTFPSRYVQAVRAARDGTFTLRALPPDESYLIVALDYLEQGEQQDPEFLATLRAKARRVSLTEGEKKTVALTLTEG
jgi:hypothetical protein